MRVLELYAGIGGFAAALPRDVEVVAVEQSPVAAAVYRNNFGHAVRERNLAGVSAEDLARIGADLWWMSPPCQPHTRRGRARDVSDPRARSFLHVIDAIARAAPPFVALENVEEFARSEARTRFVGMLLSRGYALDERIVCPTELGIPMRRRRYFLAASRTGEPVRLVIERRPMRALSGFIDRSLDARSDLQVPERIRDRYRFSLSIQDPAQEDAVLACFTAAYGRSWVRSGSYLRTSAGIRRLAPEEILGLLDFPRGFRLDEALPLERRLALLGSSLSVTVVREVVSAILGASRPRDPAGEPFS